MELKDLVGPHELTGVDLSNGQVKGWYGDDYEDATTLSFRLDGVTYTAIEDPDDGYRSSMREIAVTDHALENTFPGVAVVGRYRDRRNAFGDDNEPCDILELVSADTGEVVLEVGTENAEDYYPSFVACWTPENLSLSSTEGATHDQCRHY